MALKRTLLDPTEMSWQCEYLAMERDDLKQGSGEERSAGEKGLKGCDRTSKALRPETLAV